MLFADQAVSAGLWSTKEVFTAVCTLLSTAGGLVGWFISHLSSKHKHEMQTIQKEMDRLKEAKESDISNGEGAMKTLQAQLDENQEQLIDTQKQLDEQKLLIDQLRAIEKRLLAEQEGLKTNFQSLEDRKTSLDEQYRKELAAIEARAEESEKQRLESMRVIESARKKSGFTWSEKVLCKVPPFKPLAERHTPILSVANLKVGVGKTTITANLAATLARMGWRVLVIDLDLQGSLTSLFLEAEQTAELDNEEKLVGHFLDAAFNGEARRVGLAQYVVPALVDEPGVTCDIVPSTDSLAYAENNLTVRWYLRDGLQDARFLLRKEIHSLKRVRRRYDIILIDCPPVLNVSCLNALAASDFLLVPVMPSKQSTDRIGPLIDRLKEFQENVNPALQVLGFVANRTRAIELTICEKERMNELSRTLKDKGVGARTFITSIRQSAEIRESEDTGRPLNPDDDLSAAFRRFAEEVITALPEYCDPKTKLRSDPSWL